MKICSVSTLALLFCLPPMVAQVPANDPQYVRLVDTAFTLLQKGDCRPCLTLYEQAFQRARHSALSHLRAALCAEWCGDSLKAEQLSIRAVLISWATCEKVLQEPQNYPEFHRGADDVFVQRILARTTWQAQALGIDLELRDRLQQIHHDDQQYRAVSNPHPPGSPEHQAFMAAYRRNDSLNLVKIEGILQTYGYPGKSLVGDTEASTAWLVIQHSPLEKQLQYFPMLDEAARKGELRRSEWAMLVDRIRTGQGQPQLYGSQIVRDPESGGWMLHPLEDPANVNRRRAEVGLGPLEDYALRFGIVWKPD